LELAEAFDRKNVGRFQYLVLPIKILVGLVEVFLVGDGEA